MKRLKKFLEYCKVSCSWIPGSALRAAPERRSRRKLSYYVYLLASRKYGTLYVGVTSELIRRVYEHKSKVIPGFTAKYAVDRLVWFECHDDPSFAIMREKEIKKWRRDWKISLIEENNSDWLDLYDAMSL